MADSYLDDYTKYRVNHSDPTWSGVAPPNVEDYIGRPDYVKVKSTYEFGDVSTTSGTILV